MYAIVETGGKQYRVSPGDTVAVERLAGEPGETVDLEQVLLLAGDQSEAARVGSPEIAGAVVRAEVVEHIRGEKIVVFRYKSKVRYRRKTGHRQSLTRLRITDILVDGESTVATVAAEPEPVTAPVMTVADPELEASDTPETSTASVPNDTSVTPSDEEAASAEVGEHNQEEV
jgi:large subunit ribosomal protein L21